MSESRFAPVLTAGAMREADRRTIEDLGFPGHTLMETAGRSVADEAERRYGPVADKRVVVLCGRGNNGGDGLVIARVLATRGARVHVILSDPEAKLSPDAALNYRLLVAAESVEDSHDTPAPPGEPGVRIDIGITTAILGALERPDFVVDALLGTGQHAAPRSPLDDAVRWINGCGGRIIAVDMPTGIGTDDGSAPGACVRADLTVTFGALKPGLVLGEGRTMAGDVTVAEIGIPRHILDEGVHATGCARISGDRGVASLLAELPAASTKYSSGPTLVVGGSRQYTGAPVMCATAAARAGSGYVLCAAPESARGSIETRSPEIPFISLPDDPDGRVAGRTAVDTVVAATHRSKAVVIGPGLGRSESVSAFVDAILSSIETPCVVDADGLNAVSGAFLAAQAAGRWIITPHEAEFLRLGGDPADRGSNVARAAAAAVAWQTVVVLKGLPSVVAAPDGRVIVAGTGNPALASAGTGDVLAGLCAGMLARGLPPFEAAVAAVHIGGAAADRFLARSGRSSMMAGDMLRQIGPVLRERIEIEH